MVYSTYDEHVRENADGAEDCIIIHVTVGYFGVLFADNKVDRIEEGITVDDVD